ncbi:MAG: hypothetical protein MZV70_07045, partial [Desulfobacterales bacterium]|nr:hypothetical protein [Desulfobacterales bacterium]
MSITSNTASGSNGFGGGIYLAGTTNNSVSLTRSLISGNSATNYGGGIANWGNGSSDSPVGGTLYLENVTIGQNSAQSNGAGVYLNSGSRSYFVNRTIAYNTNLTSANGGAGVLCPSYQVNLSIVT